ncbi:MAG: polysaccharide deacetylase family protein [Candidatus Omnitrophota bacterium]
MENDLKKNNARILMYHSIGTKHKSEINYDFYHSSEDNFKEQMQYLKEHKDIAITLTFDDGYESSYKYAYPILKKMGFSAYFFVIGSKIGSPGYLNWQQIKELKDSGMIIGSHGMTHKILTELKDEDLDYELRASKKLLEENLGQSVNYFSIPGGLYNRKIIQKAKACGYRAVFTSRLYETGYFKIGRIAINGVWDLRHFIRIVNNGYSLQERILEFIKDLSKKTLGTKRYEQLRTRILNRWK